MHKPLLTCLSYSAGVQSHGILRMVLAGMIERPERFAVVCADPGMESHVSYRFAAWAKQQCANAGIPFLLADGPSLFTDLTELKTTNKTRLDTPPLWTKNSDGTTGQLMQGCTAHYKIAPIRRSLRDELYRQWAIPVGHRGDSALAEGCVEQWIGFTADEASRAQKLLEQPNPKYMRFAFPLIGKGLTKADVVAIYEENEWPIPVRSMCNGCPYHGLRSLKEMHDERPTDWQQAVMIDEASRDLTQIAVNNPCYVSQTLIPLTELAARDFKLEDPIENDLAQCPSGACFV